MYRFLLITVFALSLFAGALRCAPAQAGTPFGLDDVAALAARSAAGPYRDTGDAATTVPAALSGLGYDAMRDIRWRPERALWRDQGLPFELQFFHVGGGRQPVQVNQIVDGRVQPVRYDPRAWTFGANRIEASVLAGLGEHGFAGFRVHTALNNPGVKDELIVFLGASYFRALGIQQLYGVSARALAIDTVGAPPGHGEEFPRFTTFWIERPAPGATGLVILGLMESPRASGAYRFTVRPGAETIVDVQQRLYLREPVARLGIAPLTSMYAFGENQPQPSRNDFRPEVHDSDGLMLAADGESLWRPLVNPPSPLPSSFTVHRLQGFGLMQRDRRFTSYEDDEAHYERRPSAWVEPVGDWGAGRVELLQLPTPDETHDNIVAYWVPAVLPKPGTALSLSYRLHWQGDLQQQQAMVARVVQTRRGTGWKVAEHGPDGVTEPATGGVVDSGLSGRRHGASRSDLQYLIDFDGPTLASLPADAPVRAVATAGPGARVTEARAWRHPVSGWRMQLRVQRDDPAKPTELRAFLQSGPHALTETWAALVPAEPHP